MHLKIEDCVISAKLTEKKKSSSFPSNVKFRGPAKMFAASQT
jgi:hypothetical protein